MALGDGPVPLQAAGDVRGLRGLPERVVGPGEERAVRVSGVRVSGGLVRRQRL
jgi:hypothetical protein